MRGDGRKARDPKKTLLRLLGYMMKYWHVLVIVLVCIFVNAVASSQGSVALGRLVDDFILPMVANGNSDFAPVVAFLTELAVIYIVGMIASFLLNFLMVGVTQGIQKKIRDDMFAGMQRLPLRYFDSHAAGDIMSRYTSDVDTMRQMISQSIPQTVSSLTTLFVLLYRMLTTSWILTCVCMVTVAGVIFVTKTLAGKSGKFFIGQQRSLGAVNGYIEEMVNGQKVVKVFSHEDTCKKEFDELNEKLRQNAYSAGKFANMMGPINNNLGYVQYAVLAIVGGFIVVASEGSMLTLGKLMAFMMLSKTFNMPINMISNQINSVIMALAGAERVFDLMDEPGEADNGYVTLVNAKEDENGNLTECEERTGRWAWKHPHGDGTLTYTELKGDIVMEMVDFAYVPEKQVLYDVTLYARPGQKIAFVGATGAGKTTKPAMNNRMKNLMKLAGEEKA